MRVRAYSVEVSAATSHDVSSEQRQTVVFTGGHRAGWLTVKKALGRRKTITGKTENPLKRLQLIQKLLVTQEA